MSLQLSLTAPALAGIEKIKPCHRFAIRLVVLGLAALASTGASACGRLPAGVELSGPVLRGDVIPHKAEAQPVIMPHCNFTPPADAGAVSSFPDRPDNSSAIPANRQAAPN